ncbi:MAG: class I SAM-dependent methyltransferase [Methylococcales bacterium]
MNTSYEPFSMEPVYIEANRGFVQRGPFHEIKRFLDLACGTGTVSELLLERVPAAHLTGVDLDSIQIELSAERFRNQRYLVRSGFELSDERVDGKPVLNFATGSADELPFPDACFDCVTMANAIHLVSDRKRLLDGVSRVLSPCGVFGFNTTFYAGAMPEGTQRIYVDWLRLASDYIKDKSRQLEARGMPPIKRVHGTTRGAFKNRWYNKEEWTACLADSGLEVVDVHEREVVLDAHSLALVGAYGGLAEVLLSGFPVAEASEGLQASAAQALFDSKCSTIARNYLEIWARSL